MRSRKAMDPTLLLVVHNVLLILMSVVMFAGNMVEIAIAFKV